MENNDTLIATLFNPRYQEGIFKKMCVPLERANVIITLVMNKCAQMVSQNSLVYEFQGPQSDSNELSESDHYDLMRHLGKPPIETNVAAGQSHKDKVLAYLQNFHPMFKG
ncbi:hypothetical protein O181_020830 [Austropuccinia psidii MF-1]|uniref:Uncharacterized protein n=1 Tax=Austropuccinia psidii MF-1 TaxID=1389203 RepID=A0A9Q3CDC9_9BASI|nr:hypothetical protein [Austropuccinia psidii MF-1]